MSPKTTKLHLTPDGDDSSIVVEGHRLEGVTSINLAAGLDDVPRLTVDLRMHEIDAHGEFTVQVPDRAAATLRALGWTPPAADEERTPGWDDFEQLVRNIHRTTVWPEPHVSRLIAEAGRARAEADRHREKVEQLRARLDTVLAYVNERRDFIRVLRQYSTEDMADYHRWTGHAEARRVLAEMLALDLDEETGGLKATEEPRDA